MPTTLKLHSGRQTPRWAYIDVVLANLATGVSLNGIQVPAGAIVVDGWASVTEVFNSTSSDVLDIGDSGVGNRYKNDVNLQALGLTKLVPTGYIYTVPTILLFNWVSGGGTPTTGKVTVAVCYIVRGFADVGPEGLGPA